MPRVRDVTFLPEIISIHERTSRKAKELEDFSFSWLDEILREAKKAFHENEVYLLPKTPSAKAASRRRRRPSPAPCTETQVEENGISGASSARDEIEGTEESTPKAPARKTRASRKPAAKRQRTSDTVMADSEDSSPKEPARKTRGSRKPTAKARNTKSRRGRNKVSEDSTGNKDTSMETEASADSEDMGPVASEQKTPERQVSQPVSPAVDHVTPKLIVKPLEATATTQLQTPIRSFSKMNMKEKIHAYEDKISHAPSPASIQSEKEAMCEISSDCSETPKVDNSQKTPGTIVLNSNRKQSLPKTPENVASVPTPCTVKATETLSKTPVPQPIKRKSTPRLSSHGRKSLRASLLVSLKCLPSQDKPEKPVEVEVKPARARTRLRLKKKTNTEVETTMTESQSSEDTDADKPTTPQQEEEMEEKRNEETEADSTEDASEEDDMDTQQDEADAKTTAPAKARVTRSKMRKPQEEVKVDVLASPAPSEKRVTRTKTRKRQHEEDSDGELNSSKRSCVEETDMTCNQEDEMDKASAAKVIRPHPKSFLNSLKPGNNPLRPVNFNPGLVRSFITRNSPAKPSLKEIQEKKKQELLEKTKKNEERMRQRDEEHKKKMEEMRKKREEKMRKVMEIRDLKQQQEKENRLMLERKLMEKRQVTNKLKEDRMKEEKEKQKMRHQKMEEAEERRNQEESERQKKLQDQLENEKYHKEWLQRKKEFEELERQKKIEEEKQKLIDRHHEIEKEREKERARLHKIEEERRKEWQKKKEERERQAAEERAEKEKQLLEAKRERELELKKETERLKKQERLRLAEQEKAKEEERLRQEELRKLTEKHNAQIQQQQTSGLPKPNLNKTHSLPESSVPNKTDNNDSYEMTPQRPPAPCVSTAENYNIDDLSSGDETDDDTAPRKKIPYWAEGSHFKSLLIKQHFEPPDLDLIFDVIQPPDLNVLFEKKKARFNKRTSSAHWDTPVLKPGNLRPNY